MTKIVSRVNTLHKLVPWENRWEINFNINKYRVIYIRKISLKFQSKMNNGWIKSVNEERDLGMLISKDLKFSKQCPLEKNS